MKYAITGGDGLLGTEFQKKYGPPIASFRGDVCDAEAVDRWVYSLEDFETLIHLAAVVPKQVVDNNMRMAHQVNVGGTLNILESLKKRKDTGRQIPWLFYASTSHVYKSSNYPIKEDAHLEPFTLYGLTKLQGEQLCHAYRRDFNLAIGIGRIFSFSHPKQPDYYFIPAMFRKIRAAEYNAEVKISGIQGSRDFLRTEQICFAIRELAKRKFNDVVNIATGHSIKLFEVVEMIRHKAKRPDVKLQIENDKPNYLIANNSKLKSLDIILNDELETLIEEIALDRTQSEIN